MKYRDFFQRIKEYRWKRQFKHYFLLTLVAIIVPILISGGIFLIYNNVQGNERAAYDADYITKEIIASYSRVFGSVDDCYALLSNDAILQSFLLNQEYISADTDARHITEQMKNSSLNVPGIRSIYLYSSETDYVLSTTSSNFRKRFFDLGWYDKYIVSNGRELVFPRKLSDDNVLTIIKPVYTSNYSCGVLVFNLNINELNISIVNSYEYLKEVYVYDLAGNIIISNVTEALGKRTPSLSCKSNSVSTTNIVTNINNKSGYSIITLIKNTFSMQYLLYMILILSVMCITIIGSFVISFVTSSNYFKNIFAIMKLLNQNSGASVMDEDEYKYISNNLLSLIDARENIEYELTQKMQVLRQSQLYALQNQISPHFIFNTLNLIILRDRSQNKTNTEISMIVELLADIMRSALDTPNYIVTLETEIEYLKKYVDLQNIKYADKFELTVDLAEETKDAEVLKFILQPIVENAIMHGFLPNKMKHGYISVRSTIEHEQLMITIANNGTPIPDEQLIQIRAAMNEEKPRSGHIGLQNVHQRLRLAFGDAYGIEVFSGDETVVRYTLPMNRRTLDKPE